MHNDELDMALESAYKDGYYQALADMGYVFDDEDEASEDVDIFSEDFFDEAMEGNKALRRRYEMKASGADLGDGFEDPARLREFRDRQTANSTWDKNINRRTPSASRERLLDGKPNVYTTKRKTYCADKVRNRSLNKASDMTKTQIASMKSSDYNKYIDDAHKADAKRYHTIKNMEESKKLNTKRYR